MRFVGILCACALGACIIDGRSGPPACTAGETYAIDVDQTYQYSPGVDAGYYLTYVGAGQWHLEWTCDTALSAAGCVFSGSIIADAPPSGPNASCFRCEPDDSLVASAGGPGQMQIDFDTDTTTGIDGVDFTSVPGHPITLDLQVNGLYQLDLVHFISNGADLAPACSPFALAPAAP